MRPYDSSRSARVDAELLDADLNLAMTLLDTESISGDAEHKRRCRTLAWQAYETVGRLLQDLPQRTASAFETSDYERIQRKLQRLRIQYHPPAVKEFGHGGDAAAPWATGEPYFPYRPAASVIDGPPLARSSGFITGLNDTFALKARNQGSAIAGISDASFMSNTMEPERWPLSSAKK